MVHPVDPDATKHTYTRYKCMHKLHQITIYINIYLYVFTFTVFATHRYVTSLWFICYMCMCACVLWVWFIPVATFVPDVFAFVHILTEHEKQQFVNGPSSTKGNFIGHAAPWFCLRTRVRRRTSNGRGWYTLGILLCGWNLSSLLHFVLICFFYRIEIKLSTFSGALQQRVPAARDETVQRPRNGIRTNLPALRFGLKSWHIQCGSYGTIA